MLYYLDSIEISFKLKKVTLTTKFYLASKFISKTECLIIKIKNCFSCLTYRHNKHINLVFATLQICLIDFCNFV